MKTLARLPVVAAFAGVSLASSLAAAHVRLVSPTPRYPTPTMASSSTDIKDPPCGRAGGATRTTDTTRITVYEPGQTITVQFNETVNHGGWFRIAFDDDGQDAFVTPLARAMVQMGPTFTLPILADNITDTMNGGSRSVMVTLPNVECERCTLQLIQVMDVTSTQMTWAVDDIYYTCADIAIRRTGGMGGAGGMGGSGGAIPPMGGSGGTSGNGGGSFGGAGGVATGGTGGDAAGAGGAATGGTTATGGVATGGTATGGTSTGGALTGGSGGAPATGGTAPGGGAPTGGTPATGGTNTNSGADDNAVDEEGGCRMAPASKGGHAFLAAALAALGVALRRRRGSRSSAV